jgi:hypothetical protein
MIMNYWNRALAAVYLMIGTTAVHATIIEGPISDFTLNFSTSSSSGCADTSCTASEVPSGSYSVLSDLLALYSIGDTVDDLEIVGYISRVFCDPASSIEDGRVGTVLTGNYIFRQRERIVDAVWQGQAEVTWYQQASTDVPEPSTLFLLALSLASFGFINNKKK